MKKLEIYQMEAVEGGGWKCWLGATLLAIGCATGIAIIAGGVVATVAAIGAAEISVGGMLIDKHC